MERLGTSWCFTNMTLNVIRTSQNKWINTYVYTTAVAFVKWQQWILFHSNICCEIIFCLLFSKKNTTIKRSEEITPVSHMQIIATMTMAEKKWNEMAHSSESKRIWLLEGLGYCSWSLPTVHIFLQCFRFICCLLFCTAQQKNLAQRVYMYYIHPIILNG